MITASRRIVHFAVFFIVVIIAAVTVMAMMHHDQQRSSSSWSKNWFTRSPWPETVWTCGCGLGILGTQAYIQRAPILKGPGSFAAGKLIIMTAAKEKEQKEHQALA